MSKFLTNVESPPGIVRSANKFEGRLKSAASGFPYHPKQVTLPKRLMDYPWSAERRTPTMIVQDDGIISTALKPLGHLGTAPELGGVYDSLGYLLLLVRREELVEWVKYHPTTLGETLSGLKLPALESQSAQDELDGLIPALPMLGGTISFIQEGGGKLRSVANPFRWWQTALSPLADSLYSLLKDIPWDSTHNQYGLLPAVQESLKNGDTWYSVDISSATDTFPLNLQLMVLEHLYQGDDYALESIRLFDDVSRLKWYYRADGGELKYTAWTKGQPMGLKPSFASFALTHGLILYTLNDFQWNGDFVVLGDDVIIKGAELHVKYRQFLESYGVPVSDSKTLQGNVAEFASLLVTPDNLVPVRKWRTSTTDNFVDLARLWGPKSFNLFTKRERRVLDRLRLIPPEYGGLGWGEPGQWDWKIPTWLKPTGTMPEGSISPWIHKQIYSSGLGAKHQIRGQIPDVPEYWDLLQALVRSTLNCEVTDPSLLRAFAANAGLFTSLNSPSMDWDGSRPTTLSLWEKKLGL